MTRETLSQRHRCETFKLRHGNAKASYHVTLGYYDDRRLGEVFISTNQVGSLQNAMGRDLAILSSIALQYGAPPEVIAHALTRESDGTPSTIIGAVFDRILKERPCR